MIEVLKKAWYKSKRMMFGSIKAVSNVTFETTKFFVRNAGWLLLAASVVGALAIMAVVSRNNGRNGREELDVEAENNGLRRENNRLRRENFALSVSNMYIRERRDNVIININTDENIRIREQRRVGNDNNGSDFVEGVRYFWNSLKEKAINYLDNKKNDCNEWADSKIRECDEAYNRLFNTAVLNSESRCDVEHVYKSDLPTYDEVMIEKSREEELTSQPLVVNIYEPSAPTEEEVCVFETETSRMEEGYIIEEVSRADRGLMSIWM